MAEAISSSSSVASGAQLAVLAMVQAQQTSDASPPGRSAAAQGQAQAASTAALGNQASSASAGRTRKAAGQGSAKDLDEAVKSLQDYIKPQEVITLQVDKESGQPFVKIVNAQTKQLILQIPSAQVLAMARKLQEMATPQAASGVLVDREG
jgi:flagellar protein FlaG